MSTLIYTCVFGDYDRVFPPIRKTPGADYVIVTDDVRTQVAGWRTIVVDTSRFQDGRRANRYYKIVGHRELGDHDASVYVDGNVRILDDLSPLLSKVTSSGAAMGLFRHRKRSSVSAEVEACVAGRKVSDAAALRAEYADYLSRGFPDDRGLVEATILMKNHSHPQLDDAMEMWWTLFNTHGTRDQVSLPFVLWSTGLPVFYHDGSFRDRNAHFGVYPHAGSASDIRMYAHLRARSFDSLTCKALLAAWHAKWSIQRTIRRIANGRR